MSALYKKIAPLFLAVELGLYIVILFFYEAIPYPDFIGIAIAVAFSLCFFHPTLPNLLLNVGLLATLGADVFLVLLDHENYDYQVIAMLFFSITQLSYFVYLFLTEKRSKIRNLHIAVRGGAILAAETAMLLVLKENTDALSVLSLFYIANLAVNGIFAYAQGKKVRLFAIGLTLFLCCDLFVGFTVAIGNYIPAAESSLLYRIVFSDFNFVWFFYLPSQVCISLYTALRRRQA